MRREYKIVLVRESGLDDAIEKTIFQRTNLRVLRARDGLDAITLARTELPDLVILRFDTTDLTGPDACAKLKAEEKTRGIPVLIVCEQDSEEARRPCKLAGADALLSRSSSLDPTMSLIARLLHIPPRRPVRMTVIFAVQSVGGTKAETLGKAVNLSEGGMGVEVNRPLDVGTDLELRFVLPGDGQKIEAGGRVQWVDRRAAAVYMMGVAFTNVPNADRSRLNRYLDKSLTQP